MNINKNKQNLRQILHLDNLIKQQHKLFKSSLTGHFLSEQNIQDQSFNTAVAYLTDYVTVYIVITLLKNYNHL